MCASGAACECGVKEVPVTTIILSLAPLDVPAPCAPPTPGVPAAILAAPPTGGQFDGDSLAVSASALILVIALFAVFLARRGWRGGLPLAVLAGVSLLFAALATAWVWQLRVSFSGGCALSLNARPFSEDQALSLAPLLSVVLAVLALVWLVVAVRTVLIKGATKV